MNELTEVEKTFSKVLENEDINLRKCDKIAEEIMESLDKKVLTEAEHIVILHIISKIGMESRIDALENIISNKYPDRNIECRPMVIREIINSSLDYNFIAEYEERGEM